MAELAIEIASRGGNRERPTAGKDMIKGLLFNGIYMHCTRITVDQRIVATTNVLPYFTITSLSLPHFAAVRAKLAAYTAVLKGSEKRGKLVAKIPFL